MNEYHKIKNEVSNILIPLGLSESKSDTETDMYGSVYCIYSCGEKRVMIEWNGEEGFGSVSLWQGNNNWVSLEPIVLEGSESEFTQSLEELCKVVREQL
ncbi:hypothetical protein IO699_004987 [Vibrio parahaemolyticus]|nr:hypothetical protein [Vibrio parahaemolyticus]